MTKSDLWNIDSIKVEIKDKDNAEISYKSVDSYTRYKFIEVKLSLLDVILGKTITKKVTDKVKSLAVRLEKENQEILELMKWQEDFNKK